MQTNTETYSFYSFISRWIFSTNHKDIGTLYLIFGGAPLRLFFRRTISKLITNSFSNILENNRNKFTNKLMDQFLIFQFNVCSTGTRQLLPKNYYYFLVISVALDLWWLLAVYVFLMIFCCVTVALGKLFPQTVGISLTRFYKQYSSPKVFNEYCGNPFSSIAGGAGKVLSTGSGRVVIAAGGAILGQDAAHKSGLGQIPKYQVEKALNGGIHPTGKPFVFKPNGPSWGDNLSKGLRPSSK